MVSLFGTGEIEIEDRADVEFAGHLDETSALPHYPVDAGQSEPAARLFSGSSEIGLEQVSLHLGSDSAPRIANAQSNIIPRLDALLRCLIVVDRDNYGRDCEAPAARHGVPRIGHQYRQDLLDLPAIGHDRLTVLA